MRLVDAFFGDIKGYFVEAEANKPRARTQTWLQEQSGWTGVLVEPQPALAIELRAKRKARVYEVACSSPENAGRNLRASPDGHHMTRRAPRPKGSSVYRFGPSTAP